METVTFESEDVTHDDLAAVERHMLALYELRLAQVGAEGAEGDEDRKAKVWASALLSEAMCVLEIRFGVEAAYEMVRAMLSRSEACKGPRTRGVRQ
jgi:hypothetical protein